MIKRQRYRYVGPEEIRRAPGDAGAMDIVTPADLDSWTAGQDVRDADGLFTFVVTTAGTPARGAAA